MSKLDKIFKTLDEELAGCVTEGRLSDMDSYVEVAKQQIKDLMLELRDCDYCGNLGYTEHGGMAMEDDLVEKEPCPECSDYRKKVKEL